MVKRNRRKKAQKPPKIKIKATQKNITSRGGLVSIINFMHFIDYETLFEKESTFDRGPQALYSLYDIVLFSVIGYISGISPLFGTATVWKDKVLRKMTGYRSAADETTIGRVFGALRAIHIAEFETFNHQLRKKGWRKSKTLQAITEKIWVDADSTVISLSGDPEGAAKGYNPKRGAKSYHPLLAYCTATKEILQGWFRTGAAYTSNGIVEFTKQLLAQLEGRKIVFRADSGFFNGELFALLEAGEHDYLVKVKLKNLKSLLAAQTLIGVGKPQDSPPSEPYVRFSRIRLCCRSFPHRDRHNFSRASCMVKSPTSAGIGPLPVGIDTLSPSAFLVPSE